MLRNGEVQHTAELFVDDVLEWNIDNADWSIEASQELVVYWMLSGEQGTSEVRPSDANANGLGRSWALPLPAGTVHLSAVSEDLMMINGNGVFGDFSEIALQSDLLNVGTNWNKTIVLDAAQVVHITTTSDAQLMLSIGGMDGATAWKVEPDRCMEHPSCHLLNRAICFSQIQIQKLQQSHGEALE